MTAMASQITCVSTVCLVVCSDTDKNIKAPPVTGLCAGNSPVAREFPAQKANNAENASIGWRHHILWGNTGELLHFTLIFAKCRRSLATWNSVHGTVVWMPLTRRHCNDTDLTYVLHIEFFVTWILNLKLIWQALLYLWVFVCARRSCFLEFCCSQIVEKFTRIQKQIYPESPLATMGTEWNNTTQNRFHFIWCCYNAVQYNMILRREQQKRRSSYRLPVVGIWG